MPKRPPGPQKPLLRDEHAKLFATWLSPETRNLAVLLKDSEQQALADRCKREYELDDSTRSEWKKKYRQWMDLAMQVAEEKTYPWPGACYSLDTDILTDQGWRPVADVQVGDMVLSRGPDRRADYYPVTRTFRHHALSLVHFQGKSIDLLVTPNHRMLVESKFGKRKRQHFIEAGRFLDEKLAWRYIPLTSEWEGENAATVHGIDAKAYARFLGWFISEGSCFSGILTRTLRDGTVRDYGRVSSSFAIAQHPEANGEKYCQIRRDIEACGFTCKPTSTGFIVHARSMSEAVKAELRSLGLAHQKHIPQHMMGLSAGILRELLDTLVMGDGCVRQRKDRQESWAYYTVSRRLAGQVQEICQKIGWRGTVTEQAAAVGGVINGRVIAGSQIAYTVHINQKARIQVAKMERRLVREPQEVACVEVAPHHTVYVRRNGKALWCGNSNVLFPLLTVASIQFNARAYPAIIQGRNVVKGSVIGKDDGIAARDPQTGQPRPGANGEPLWLIPPGAKQNRADRIGRHMSWQLLTEMPEWEGQTDRLLLIIAIAGTMFRKTYYDPSTLRNATKAVSALRLVVNYHAESFEVAPRLSEEIDLYPWQIESNIRGGLFLDQDYGVNEDAGEDEQAPVTFIEQHRRWDLDADGYDEPVIVTFAKNSGRLARIMPGFDAEGVEATEDGRVLKIEPVGYYTKYGFVPSPDGGVYDVGLGHLLFPLNSAINSTLNQMFDAGHLANAGGGFLGAGMSMNTGSVRFTIGEYKVINTPGQQLRENLVPLNFPGPNSTLFALLQFLVEAGREVGSIKDILTGEMPGANVPGILGLAVIQQGLKVFSAIFKRVHRALRSDYEKLFRLNRLYLPEETGFQIGSEYFDIRREDYEAGAGVEPVSDPDIVTDVQRMAQGNFLLQFAQDPWFQGREIRLRALQAAAIDQIDKLLVQQPPGNPEAMAQAAELQLRQHELALRDKELNIRAAREEGDLDIRRGKDKAQEIVALSQAILNLANAKKADAEVNQSWYDLQLRALQQQVETLNAAAEIEPSANSPAAAGSGGGAPSGAGGSAAGGVPGMAPPPGQSGGDALFGGLPGQPGP